MFFKSKWGETDRLLWNIHSVTTAIKQKTKRPFFYVGPDKGGVNDEAESFTITVTCSHIQHLFHSL